MTVDRAAWPFVAALLIVALVGAVWLHPLVAAPVALLLLFVLWFFRDPRRETPRDAAVLVAPADGRVIDGGPGRVSIFMNVFNVHVCRTPVAGRIASVEHHPGRFVAAFRDDAPQCNERTSIVVETGEAPVRFTLVAGLIARRIVCRVAPGQTLEAGQRVGLIRFGSRVDIDVPDGYRPEVGPGGRTLAGETIIARRAP